jgi:uncharacterized membrane protein
MNDTTLTNILRWIHVLAGAAWLGEVVVINFVLVPTLVRLGADKRGWFLAAIFPRIFRLASVLSLTVLLAGAALNLSMSGWQLDVAIKRLATPRWGWSILVGGLLGLGLTLFHFVVERRLHPLVEAARENPGGEAFVLILSRLQIIPRIGLGILLLILLLMMYAVRGL